MRPPAKIELAYPRECVRVRLSIRRHNDDFRHYRVIFIAIAFLGPYTAWGLKDGHTWNRGWRYR